MVRAAVDGRPRQTGAVTGPVHDDDGWRRYIGPVMVLPIAATPPCVPAESVGLTWWQIALLTFLRVSVAVIVVVSGIRWRSSRITPDFSEAFNARYGAPMAGGWTGPIEDNVQIVAEEPDRDGPPSSPHRHRKADPGDR